MVSNPSFIGGKSRTLKKKHTWHPGSLGFGNKNALIFCLYQYFLIPKTCVCVFFRYLSKIPQGWIKKWHMSNLGGLKKNPFSEAVAVIVSWSVLNRNWGDVLGRIPLNLQFWQFLGGAFPSQTKLCRMKSYWEDVWVASELGPFITWMPSLDVVSIYYSDSVGDGDVRRQITKTANSISSKRHMPRSHHLTACSA